MATVSTAKRTIDVLLIRPDVDSQTFTMAEGATLGDLLREAGAAIQSPSMLIDGHPIEEAVILRSGMTIAINAEKPSVPPKGSWQATSGMFKNRSFLREVIAEGRAIREADREAARNQTEQDDQ
jgi:hypothetical protein